MEKIIDFYYFSGTGNTFLAVKTFAEKAREKGFIVNSFRIEKSLPKEINKDHIIGIAFPIVSMMTYPFVMDFIKNLPDVKGTKIFMLATMGGSSSIGIDGKMQTILLKKGFSLMSLKVFRMPNNIFYILDDKYNNVCKSNGLDLVKLYAEDVLSENFFWEKYSFKSFLVYISYFIFVSFWKNKLHQKFFRFKLDKNKCIKCGLCKNLCPVKNISLDSKDNFPEFKLDCQYCMRCISFCPKNAISSKFQYKNKTYKATDLPFEK
jgi:NAD-dependent dihydropyrimidine dehydrogenase PreA subunit/flavodoxin